MPESDSAATQTARISEAEAKIVPAIADPYIREQLEKQRDESLWLRAAAMFSDIPPVCDKQAIRR